MCSGYIQVEWASLNSYLNWESGGIAIIHEQIAPVSGASTIFLLSLSTQLELLYDSNLK
jgi:hypothetical protein